MEPCECITVFPKWFAVMFGMAFTWILITTAIVIFRR